MAVYSECFHAECCLYRLYICTGCIKKAPYAGCHTLISNKSLCWVIMLSFIILCVIMRIVVMPIVSNKQILMTVILFSIMILRVMAPEFVLGVLCSLRGPRGLHLKTFFCTFNFFLVHWVHKITSTIVQYLRKRPQGPSKLNLITSP